MKALILIILAFSLFSFGDDFVSEESESDWLGSTTINVPPEEIDGIQIEEFGSNVISESVEEFEPKAYIETDKDWEE